VQILHVGRRAQEGFIYYIMEAADDETTGAQIRSEVYSPRSLARELRRRRRLPAGECLQLGIDLSAALDFLHQQRLIHRDIKPANIIFVRGAPKFADIGLVTDAARTGREVTYLGTPGYIAPEGPGTPAGDIYGLGKVLYEASMGLDREQFPELSGTVIERPDAPLVFQLNHIILKASHREVGLRYHSAAELRRDLLELQARAG
jgi:serine/threonine protein kinase